MKRCRSWPDLWLERSQANSSQPTWRPKHYGSNNDPKLRTNSLLLGSPERAPGGQDRVSTRHEGTVFSQHLDGTALSEVCMAISRISSGDQNPGHEVSIGGQGTLRAGDG